jgi:hypothetical protein
MVGDLRSQPVTGLPNGLISSYLADRLLSFFGLSGDALILKIKSSVSYPCRDWQLFWGFLPLVVFTGYLSDQVIYGASSSVLPQAQDYSIFCSKISLTRTIH